MQSMYVFATNAYVSSSLSTQLSGQERFFNVFDAAPEEDRIRAGEENSKSEKHALGRENDDGQYFL